MKSIDAEEAAARLARLERTGLDLPGALSGAGIGSPDKGTCGPSGYLAMYRIDSVVRRSGRRGRLAREMSGLLSVLAAGGGPFLFLVIARANRIEVMVGTRSGSTDPESLRGGLSGAMPGARVVPVDERSVQASLSGLRSTAALLGAPARAARAVADSMGAALSQARMAFVVVAEPVPMPILAEVRARALDEILATAPFVKLNQAFVQRSRETVTSEHANPALERYVSGLEQVLEEIAVCSEAGMWRVSVTLAGEDDAGLARLQASCCNAWMGGDAKEQRWEPLRVLRLTPELGTAALGLRLLAPVSLGNASAAGAEVLAPLLGGLVTPMRGQRLARVCAVPGEEYPGFGVQRRSRFQVDLRAASDARLHLGDVLDLGRATGIECRLHRQLLCKHAMVAGVTGSGKSTTCKSLLLQLSAGDRPVPFLVIEPAKREYRSLAGHPPLAHMLVFTLGEETEAPLRLNPFEVPAGASVQVHLDLLRAAFQAAFPMYPPMPQVLERCLHEVYADHGWDLLRGRQRGGGATADFPTLTDLFAKIDPVVDAMGYEARVTQDIKAALKARVGSLRIGGKGAFLDCWRSTPLGELLERPTVLELEGIADDEEKSFVLALLLMRLYEHRVAAARAGDTSSELRHVTLFEEAHRLLARVADQRGNPDAVNTKAKAVEVFANMLSEIRAYGEGIVVAEQIPTKLASDVIKNSNLKVAHRLVAAEDRELVGTSMKMSPAQREDLALLTTGEAVVFSEGFEGPCLLRVDAGPVPAGPGAGPQALRASRAGLLGKYGTCTDCPAKCLRPDAARDLASRPGIRRVLDALVGVMAVDPDALPDMLEVLRRRAVEVEPPLAAQPVELGETLVCMLVEWGELHLARLSHSADTRGRDAALWEAFSDMINGLFADLGRRAPAAATRVAARRVGERIRVLKTTKVAPFAACDGACRNICMVARAGVMIAADATVATTLAAEYGREGDDRFARVRGMLRSQARVLVGAPETTLDALATCTFIHLCADAGLPSEDACWAAAQLARA